MVLDTRTDVHILFYRSTFVVVYIWKSLIIHLFTGIRVIDRRIRLRIQLVWFLQEITCLSSPWCHHHLWIRAQRRPLWITMTTGIDTTRHFWAHIFWQIHDELSLSLLMVMYYFVLFLCNYISSMTFMYTFIVLQFNGYCTRMIRNHFVVVDLVNK